MGVRVLSRLPAFRLPRMPRWHILRRRVIAAALIMAALVAGYMLWFRDSSFVRVDDVNVVIHYDPPENHKTYLHRSGRTARAGASGVAVTFVLWDQELEVRRLKRRLQLDDLPIVRIFSNDDRLHDLAAFADALEAGEA